MVISERYKYVFVELPRTGSTSISEELIENYEGRYILPKHATYDKFLKIASEEQKKYFVFSCVRNPLDKTVSVFYKYKTYWKDRELEKTNYNIISKMHVKSRLKFLEKHESFEAFFLKFYWLPYDDWSAMHHADFDFIIKFENIQNDFSKALKLLNIEQKRPLPAKNVTVKNTKNFENLFPESTHKRARFVFGPYLKKWEYEFPANFKNKNISLISIAFNRIINVFRIIFWKHITYLKKTKQ